MKRPDGLVRVGGVGTGRIFQWAHLNPYLRLLDRARLTAFYDAAPERAARALERYQKTLTEFAAANPRWAEACRANIAELRVCASLEELLAGVDLIDVCTTTRGRMDAAVAALAAGVHSMGEKPMARTWLEADRAARAFAGPAGKSVFFQLNDDNVFDPKYLALRDLLADGAIGRPHSVWIIRGCKTDTRHILKSQALAESNGGGRLMDYGSHGLAGVWAVLGTKYRFRKVEAVEVGVHFRHRELEDGADPFVMEVDDNARFKALLEDPATGSWVDVFMEATWSGGHIGPKPLRSGGPGGGFFRIEGSDGMIDAGQPNKIVVTGWDGGETVIPLRELPGETVSFNREIETMVDCVRRGVRPEVDAAFGAEIIAACDAVYWSAIEQRAVTIDEFKAHCRTYVDKHGDTEEASLALLRDLMKPYAYGGKSL